MPRGRPTNDPKAKLFTVRIADRHVALLERRAAHDGVNVSEALRRYLDEILRAVQHQKRRSPSPEEHETFEQVFAALGLRPRQQFRRRASGRPRKP